MRRAAWACLSALVLGLSPAAAHADGPPWRIVPAESSLHFEGHDNQGGPIGGDFGKITGTITGDPDHLAESAIKIDVDLASLEADMKDTSETLPGVEWFNTRQFPHALYESRGLTKRPDGRFEAAGDLTLRGVKAPVTLVFALPVYGPKPGAPSVLRAVAKGSAKLSRAAFKVGGADWTQLIGDAVDISFTLTAEKPAQN